LKQLEQFVLYKLIINQSMHASIWPANSLTVRLNAPINLLLNVVL